MNIENLGEFGFINSIKDGAIVRPLGVIKGIGDDCAVLGSFEGNAMLVTTDILVEDVHFTRAGIPPFKLGRKSLAVNISDIAAMGGLPREALLSAAIPKTVSLDYLQSWYDGVRSMAREFDINIIGGDTSSSPEKLVINVALIGEAAEDEILYRSGAKLGDAIFLTGPVGSSAAGLDALQNNREGEKWQSLIECHNNPYPHVAAGRVISGLKLAHSLIDVSDGIASDLRHICIESGVGALVYREAIPVADTAAEYISHYALDMDVFTLHSGEDYVLLGTTPPDSVSIMRDSLKSAGCGFYLIGEITSPGQISIRGADGAVKPLATGGFDHFKR
jgi:thiamine-monophosphate kinase